MGRSGPVVAALLLIVALGASGCSTVAAGERVAIRIHYSSFDPQQVTVPVGVPVTFVLVNDDPIGHEWIVGDAAVHARHRTGTEPHHGARPTEVSIPALTTLETTVTFPERGIFAYICHLPGHEAYGMTGIVTVA
jgi:uncharacterized cupredoxin-like copper-binding protein